MTLNHTVKQFYTFKKRSSLDSSFFNVNMFFFLNSSHSGVSLRCEDVVSGHCSLSYDRLVLLEDESTMKINVSCRLE